MPGHTPNLGIDAVQLRTSSVMSHMSVAVSTLHVFIHGGVYFVRVMNLCSEVYFAKRYTISGVTFGTGRGGQNKLHSYTQIAPFSVSVLAVVANRVDTAICDRSTSHRWLLLPWMLLLLPFVVGSSIGPLVPCSVATRADLPDGTKGVPRKGGRK